MARQIIGQIFLLDLGSHSINIRVGMNKGFHVVVYKSIESNSVNQHNFAARKVSVFAIF